MFDCLGKNNEVAVGAKRMIDSFVDSRPFFSVQLQTIGSYWKPFVNSWSY